MTVDVADVLAAVAAAALLAVVVVAAAVLLAATVVEAGALLDAAVVGAALVVASALVLDATALALDAAGAALDAGAALALADEAELLTVAAPPQAASSPSAGRVSDIFTAPRSTERREIDEKLGMPSPFGYSHTRFRAYVARFGYPTLMVRCRARLG